MSTFLSYCHFSSHHLAFLLAVNNISAPTTFFAAVRHLHWHDTIAFELQAFEANPTWTLEPLPLGKKPIGCKWIFKTKLCTNGSVEHHKACLMAKRYT